jgi:hypothetical protein
MIEIRPYLKLTPSTELIDRTIYDIDSFINFYVNASEHELESIRRYFLVDNVPFAFIEKPILFEQIRQFWVLKYKIKPFEFRMIGSAKTGFSMSPHKAKGKLFDCNSDLDLVIINLDFFESLKKEFITWKEKYKQGLEKPQSPKEKINWEENLKYVPINFTKNGFIDLNKVPLKGYNEFARSVSNDLYLLKLALENANIFVKGISIRVYQDHESFYKRLKFNFKHFMDMYKL